MAGAKFDSKSFNPQAFGKYMETVPKVRTNALINSGVFKGNAEISEMFANQTGTGFGIIPMYGRISGEADNYDGVSNITDGELKTYERGIVTFGRAKAFTEKDFTYDITSGVDFMSQVGVQLQDYWDNTNEDVLLSILKGIFAMKSTAGKAFAKAHTTEVTNVDEVTCNNAIQKASGEKKQKYSFVIMHSDIATKLENKNLLEYKKYTDPNGIQSNLNIAQWGAKTVLIDDTITYDASTQKYTTFILGDGAIDYVDLGAKVPYEMDRDPRANGGKDTLYSRERLCYAPYGISYLKASQQTNSPTNAELADGQNWDLVNDGTDPIDHREIAIAKIVSTETGVADTATKVVVTNTDEQPVPTKTVGA